MLLNTSRRRTILCAFFGALAVCLSGHLAEAQEKSFKIRGEGIAPEGIPLPGDDPRPHWIVGNATHLGIHTGVGAVQTDSVDPPDPNAPNSITGEFGSAVPFVFTAANGDELACHYGRADEAVDDPADDPGTFELTIVDIDGDDLIVQACWLAEFVPQTELCTGRFAGITGGWIMFAQSEPFVLGSDDPVGYSWEGEGTLTFQKPRN